MPSSTVGCFLNHHLLDTEGLWQAGLQQYLHLKSFPVRDVTGALKGCSGRLLPLYSGFSSMPKKHFLGEGVGFRVIEIATVFLRNFGLERGMKFSAVKTSCSCHNPLKRSSFPWCGKVLFSYCI